mmetsp:Transcript_62499/g.110253  ORF Transcript_62499/g.110253 Transcript_62499/m.110253 type:complete len:243 (-) Transcript_62499:538-1266(-)
MTLSSSGLAPGGVFVKLRLRYERLIGHTDIFRHPGRLLRGAERRRRVVHLMVLSLCIVVVTQAAATARKGLLAGAHRRRRVVISIFWEFPRAIFGPVLISELPAKRVFQFILGLVLLIVFNHFGFFGGLTLGGQVFQVTDDLVEKHRCADVQQEQHAQTVPEDKEHLGPLRQRGHKATRRDIHVVDRQQGEHGHHARGDVVEVQGPVQLLTVGRRFHSGVVASHGASEYLLTNRGEHIDHHR